MRFGSFKDNYEEAEGLLSMKPMTKAQMDKLGIEHPYIERNQALWDFTSDALISAVCAACAAQTSGEKDKASILVTKCRRRLLDISRKL